MRENRLCRKVSIKIVLSNASPEEFENRVFATTHWSLIVAAGDDSSAQSAKALQYLCQTYWEPLYAHVRRLGHQPAEAQDLIQAFMTHVLEKRLIGLAERERGKFRTYLMVSLRNFLANESARNRAVKRGAGKVFTMDFQSAELAWQIEPIHEQTAERIFERHWAIAVLESAFTDLALRYSAAGKGYLFEALSRCLTSSNDAPRYQDLASDLGLSIDAIKKAVGRLRTQYAKIVRQEVAKTISDAESIEEEIQNLFQALR